VEATAKVFKLLMTMKKEIDELFGSDNWSVRKISRANKEGDPSLTLRTELETLNLKPDEYVIVAFRKDELGEFIEIRPLSQFMKD